MTQDTFLQTLRLHLQALPEAERERCVEDYRGMILDRMEDGASEEAAIAELGSPEEIARQILEEVPLTTLVKARVKPKRSLRGWEIVLLVLGAPVWLPLMIAAVAVGFSLIITLFAVVFAVLVTGVAVAGSSIAVVLCGEGDPIMMVGIVMTLLGLGTLLGIAGWGLGVRCAKGISALVRKLFLKKTPQMELEEVK